MRSDDIRKKFLEFFERKDHRIVESDLLVPRDDPTLLFTGAGMNQFKDQFMGNNITFKRAATCQKCLRTGDLENVGRTPRHHTFFEMLGNFSFGDYFKKDAILWAWEFMTKEMAFPADRLWISVYTDDDESYGIWKDLVKVPGGRIVKLGAGDNFWPADAPAKGPNGPCGPCSEIFYDWGPERGCGRPDCGPSCSCGRFVEIWNLVFTEFERKPDGTLVPLPNKNIDTGMGLERICSAVQGVYSNFETDVFETLINDIKKEFQNSSEKPGPDDIYLIADHLRAAVFAIADGVSPSNESRGYVVRKLIRRAFLRSGLKAPFLYNLVPAVTGFMKGIYPELGEKREHISAIINEEETRFKDTLDSAMPVYEDMVSSSDGRLSGEDIFKLVDTYGLPLDVIEDESSSRGIGLDMAAFEGLMEKRKEESRKGSNISTDFIFQPDLFMDAPNPGHSDDMPLEAEIIFIVKDGGAGPVINEGDRGELLTSPQSARFYAEGGGQVGDKGVIRKSGGLIEITNTYDAGGRKVMEVLVKEGSFSTGDKVEISLDRDAKLSTARNHTATHLLQAALRNVLGEHVRQSGSYVDSRRLRFDFTHMRKLTDRELGKIEVIVNEWVKNGIGLSKDVKPVAEARGEGALSFFGEKYGDTVRVVSVGGVSKEFCGGDHVDNTSEIGIIKIVNETSVASGIRRIEAVTGVNAENWVRSSVKRLMDEAEKIFDDCGGRDKTGEHVPDLAEAVKLSEKIMKKNGEVDINTLMDYENIIKPAFDRAAEYAGKCRKKRQKSEDEGAFNILKNKLDDAIDAGDMIGGIRFISGVFEETPPGLVRKAIAYAGKKLGGGIVILGSSNAGKATLLCSVSQDLVSRGYSARGIIDKVVGVISGGGGGNDTFAQAGGKKPGGLRPALDECRKIIEKGEK